MYCKVCEGECHTSCNLWSVCCGATKIHKMKIEQNIKKFVPINFQKWGKIMNTSFKKWMGMPETMKDFLMILSVLCE